MHADYQVFRAALPKVTFRRSRQRASIAAASELPGGESVRLTGVTPALFGAAVREVVAALQLLRRRLKTSDDFDLGALLARCAEAQARLPATDAELAAVLAECRARESARLAARPEWDKLGIDWRDYHPDARSLLDDVFYWDCADDFAPHGNDTGADVLGDYRKWLGRNPKGNPAHFYRRAVVGWGFGAGDPALARLADQAAVALAFAELKLRGGCRPAVAELACEAIGRQRRRAVEAADWPHRGEALRALAMLEAKLAAVTDGGPGGVTSSTP